MRVNQKLLLYYQEYFFISHALLETQYYTIENGRFEKPVIL
jgi:hypothetical protein